MGEGVSLGACVLTGAGVADLVVVATAGAKTGMVVAGGAIWALLPKISDRPMMPPVISNNITTPTIKIHLDRGRVEGLG